MKTIYAPNYLNLSIFVPLTTKITTCFSKKREQIKLLMQREIIPAIGCTEPIAVSLCTAKATEVLGCEPERISVFLVQISSRTPWEWYSGTGMNGLPIAIALGALRGKSENGLELLRDLTPEEIEKGNDIQRKENTDQTKRSHT